MSLFIDPEPGQIDAAFALRAPVVELHTGRYCEAWLAGDAAATLRELERLAGATELARDGGIEVHAGHGLDYDTATHLAAFPQVRELNIGHFIIGEAVFEGLSRAIARMREAIAEGVAQRPFQDCIARR